MQALIKLPVVLSKAFKKMTSTFKDSTGLQTFPGARHSNTATIFSYVTNIVNRKCSPWELLVHNIKALYLKHELSRSSTTLSQLSRHSLFFGWKHNEQKFKGQTSENIFSSTYHSVVSQRRIITAFIQKTESKFLTVRKASTLCDL